MVHGGAGELPMRAAPSRGSVPHRECFGAGFTDSEVVFNVEHYGCPEEICPGCYCPKRHDDRLCIPCAKYQSRLWRAVWRLIPGRVLRKWERVPYGL